MNKKVITVLVHVICCLAFLFFPVILSPTSNTQREIIYVPWPFLIFNFLLIAFFYFNVYFLIPHLLFQKRNFLYFGTILLLLIIFLYLPDFVRPRILTPDVMRIRPEHMPSGFPARPPFEGPGIFRKMPGLLSFCLIWVLGIMFKVIERGREAEQKSREAELEKVNTELSYLKLQINPHFLFNTLNNIYSLATVESPKTPAAVMKLSDIMRYVIQDAQADFVPVEKEINYLRSYIELQKLRSNDKLEVDFEADGNFSQTTIAPLLLISFVENAFKYGTSSHEKSRIVMQIFEKDGALMMLVQNTVFNRQDSGPGVNIGIANTRRRLDLLYPGRYRLDVEKRGEKFSITLKIDLGK